MKAVQPYRNALRKRVEEELEKRDARAGKFSAGPMLKIFIIKIEDFYLRSYTWFAAVGLGLLMGSGALASGWDKIIEPPEGHSIASGIPCGSGTGWQKCGYPEEDKGCKLDATKENLTMVMRYWTGVNANSLERYEVWWGGKQLYAGGDVKKTNGRSSIGGYRYSRYGAVGNIQYDQPALFAAGSYKYLSDYSNRYDLSFRRNYLYWAVCKE